MASNIKMDFLITIFYLINVSLYKALDLMIFLLKYLKRKCLQNCIVSRETPFSDTARLHTCVGKHLPRWNEQNSDSPFLSILTSVHVFSRCISLTGQGCVARGSRCAVMSPMLRPGSCRRPSPSGSSEEGKCLNCTHSLHVCYPTFPLKTTRYGVFSCTVCMYYTLLVIVHCLCS